MQVNNYDPAIRICIGRGASDGAIDEIGLAAPAVGEVGAGDALKQGRAARAVNG